jgi:RPA family protein
LETVKPEIKAKAISEATGMNKVFIWGVLSKKVKPSWETAIKIEVATGGFYKADSFIPEAKEWLDELIKQRTNV